jgi:small subunit ribosomal protein S4
MTNHSKEALPTHKWDAKRGKKSGICYPVNGEEKSSTLLRILEKQSRGLFKKKHQLLKVLLVSSLQLCEARLDNVVFRMGIFHSRRGARQLVSQTYYCKR